MARKHEYHRSNCCSKVRAVVTDKWGRKVTLMGTHAFEWSIVLEANGRVIINSFSNSKEARKEFKTLTKKR